MSLRTRCPSVHWLKCISGATCPMDGRGMKAGNNVRRQAVIPSEDGVMYIEGLLLFVKRCFGNIL